MKVTAKEALLQFEDFEEFKEIYDGERKQYHGINTNRDWKPHFQSSKNSY